MDELYQRTPEVLPKCPSTGKLSFPSKRIPKEWTNAGRKGNRIKLGAYKCPHCPYFHQTSHV